MKTFLFILLSVLLVLLVSGIYTFVLACVRRKELPWLVEEQIKKTPFGKYYPFIVQTKQWLNDHDAQDVYLTSKDGLKLHGYWIPAENPKGTVVLAHGYRSTMLVDFSGAFKHYHSMGFNILAPQQRAHGESEGKYITFGVKESEDFRQWIDYHNEHFGHQQMFLSGLSMGASTVLMAGGRELPPNVMGILADCGYSTQKGIMYEVIRKMKLPPVLCYPFVRLAARLFGGFDLEDTSALEAVKQVKVPVIFFHGETDDLVPCYMSRELYDACPTRKKLVTIPGAGHGLAFPVDREKYLAELLDFFGPEGSYQSK